MRETWKAALAILLAELLIFLPITGCGGKAAAPATPLAPEVFEPLDEQLKRPYLELFEDAATLEFSPTQISRMEDYMNQAKDYCVDEFKEKTDEHDETVKEAQEELRSNQEGLSDERRHNLHCTIQNNRILKQEAQMLADHGIPVAFDNKLAKLNLIEEWPEDLQRIQQELETGAYHDREYGDVKDIGFRAVGEGQEEDVKDGREAVDRLKRQDLLPEEVDNEVVQDYVTGLAENIAKNSDLRVPVKITVLNSKEINAFALPGGFLFVQRGLLEEAEDEAQLAGVVAHEIAHAAARHGHKLMRQATIAQILMQAAQVAALIATGGIAGIGTYYALRYGFYGLSLVLNLKLLGVSREFEMEADRLGIQYAWNAGYDPSGFVRFFDKMATTKGYVEGLSWFRTHPPFYDRMVHSKQEMMYLPESDEELTVNSSAFKQMKEELAEVTAEAEEDEKNRPSLKAPEEDCPPPEKVEYEPGQPIEAICSLPPVS